MPKGGEHVGLEVVIKHQRERSGLKKVLIVLIQIMGNEGRRTMVSLRQCLVNSKIAATHRIDTINPGQVGYTLGDLQTGWPVQTAAAAGVNNRYVWSKPCQF